MVFAEAPDHRVATLVVEILKMYHEFGVLWGIGTCLEGLAPVVDGDRLNIYHGAADTIVCGAAFSIQAILKGLE